jgi:hypothetical protein
VRRAVIRTALAELGADQLRDLDLHQLRRDGLNRLADHIGVLIEQHPLDDLLDRHPVGTGHAASPFVRALESATIFGAASAGTTFRPISTYTTLRDVTRLGAVAPMRTGEPAWAACSGLDRSRDRLDFRLGRLVADAGAFSRRPSVAVVSTAGYDGKSCLSGYQRLKTP